MKLEVEGRSAIDDPQASDLYAAVSALAVPAQTFLILSRSRASFVQVALQSGERFVIEYRERGSQLHRSVREDFSRDDVAQLLESYRAGGDAWRPNLEWRPVDGPRRRWPAAVSARDVWISVIALLAIFLVFLFSGALGASRWDPRYIKAKGIAGLILLAIPVIYWIGGWRSKS